MDDLVTAGKARFTASASSGSRTAQAMEYPPCSPVQIIYNILRQRRPSCCSARQAPPGRHPGAAAAVVGAAGRQAHARQHVRRRRPPRFNRNGERSIAGRPSRAFPTKPACRSSEELRALVPAGTPMRPGRCAGSMTTGDVRDPRAPSPDPGRRKRRGGGSAPAAAAMIPESANCTTAGAVARAPVLGGSARRRARPCHRAFIPAARSRLEQGASGGSRPSASLIAAAAWCTSMPRPSA